MFYLGRIAPAIFVIYFVSTTLCSGGTLGDRVVHTDPAKYQQRSGVHAGAGDTIVDHKHKERVIKPTSRFKLFNYPANILVHPVDDG